MGELLHKSTKISLPAFFRHFNQKTDLAGSDLSTWEASDTSKNSFHLNKMAKKITKIKENSLQVDDQSSRDGEQESDVIVNNRCRRRSTHQRTC